MKLSYREKIGLLVLIVALVVIVAIAWPIRDARNKIKIHTEEHTKVEQKYDDTQRKIAQIPNIESNINKMYEESKGISEKFAKHMENIEFDKYFEELLNKEPYKANGKNTLELTSGISISDPGKGSVDFYYYKPNVLTYPLLEAADTNGTLLEDTNKPLYDKVQNALYMKSLDKQSVEVRKASIKMRFTKESLLALEDELQKTGTGIRITGVSISDYTFANASQIPDKKGYSDGTVNFEFYTLQQIQKPDFSK